MTRLGGGRARRDAQIRREDGDPRVLNEMGPGEMVGEVALFAGGKRTMDVRALTASRLAALSRQGFDRLLERSPTTWQKVAELVMLRLRQLQLSTYLNPLFGPFGESEAEILEQLQIEAELITLKPLKDLPDRCYSAPGK